MAVVFDGTDGRHDYTLTETGERCTSVTELVGRHFRPFDSDAVAARVVKIPSSQYFRMDPKAVTALWDLARDQGTLLHARIADFYSGVPVRSGSGDGADFLNFLRFDLYERRPRGWKPFRIEWPVVAPPYLLAGTVDAIFRSPGGECVLVDWKRSKHPVEPPQRIWSYGLKDSPLADLPDCPFSKFTLQLSLYSHIVATYYDIVPCEMWVVRFPPDCTPPYEMTQIAFDKPHVDAILASLKRDSTEI